MRKLILLSVLTLAAAASGLYSAKAATTTDNCVTYCGPINSCGYICCTQTCCGNRCIDLDCAPPPSCPGDN